MTSSMDLTRQQDGGVMKKTMQQGTHPFIPVKGDCLSVKYTCRLDSGDEKGKIVEDHNDNEVLIIMGQTTVLPAVEACLLSMQPGERCELFVEPEHAYADKGFNAIPPHSRLRFDILLVRIRGVDVSEDRDGSIRKSVVKLPSGRRKVTRGTQVMIRYRHIPPGSVVDVGPWRSTCFTLGCASRTPGLTRSVDFAVLSLKRGEVGRFSFDDGWMGDAGMVSFVEVELVEYEKYDPAWKMNVDQKLNQSLLLKQKAAKLVEEQLPDVALPLYHRIISYLETDVGFSESSQQQQRVDILKACRLNAALCNLRVGQPASTIEQCTAVLEMDADNEKALYRRAEARRQVGEFAEAVADLERLLSRYPNNSSAKRLLKDCREMAKADVDREKEMCVNVFERIHEWGAGVEDNAYGPGGDYPIDVWRNDLAAHMMSIPEELEAFGEEMPQLRHRHQSQSSVD